jgi:HTH-type transcriptional regulator/antitoxin MqsA
MIDGRRVLVETVPAKVCERCGEVTFSRQTRERIRKLVHETREPVRTVPMEVLPFDSANEFLPCQTTSSLISSNKSSQ